MWDWAGCQAPVFQVCLTSHTKWFDELSIWLPTVRNSQRGGWETQTSVALDKYCSEKLHYCTRYILELCMCDGNSEGSAPGDTPAVVPWLSNSFWKVGETEVDKKLCVTLSHFSLTKRPHQAIIQQVWDIMCKPKSPPFFLPDIAPQKRSMPFWSLVYEVSFTSLKLLKNIKKPLSSHYAVYNSICWHRMTRAHSSQVVTVTPLCFPLVISTGFCVVSTLGGFEITLDIF